MFWACVAPVIRIVNSSARRANESIGPSSIFLVYEDSRRSVTPGGEILPARAEKLR